MNDIPQGILPVYRTDKPNQPICLYKGAMQLIWSRQSAKALGDGQLCLEWLPEPRIRFEVNNSKLVGQTEGFDSISGNDGNLYLKLVEIDVSCSALILSHRPDVFDDNYFKGILTEPLERGNCEDSSYFLAHAVNFEDVIGLPVCYQKLQKNYRVTLRSKTWNITIDATPSLSSNLKRSTQSSRGYTFTHTIKLEKVKNDFGACITDVEVCEQLEMLGYLLSLAKGSWSNALLPVGFNPQGREVWSMRNMCKLGAYIPVCSWFSGSYTCEALPQVFPGFIRLWDNDIWREALRYAVT
ncbi:MAG: hypothetical protein ACFB5Z_03660 [Elainellaceae cyanobacterium]